MLLKNVLSIPQILKIWIYSFVLRWSNDPFLRYELEENDWFYNTLFFYEHLPWWGKVFIITRAPQFTASTPTVYVQNNNPLQLRQVDFSSIHFKLMKEGKISYSFAWPSLHIM